MNEEDSMRIPSSSNPPMRTGIRQGEQEFTNENRNPPMRTGIHQGEQEFHENNYAEP
jgi:hypothetical protein